MTTRRSATRIALLSLFGLAGAHCSAAPSDRSSGSTNEGVTGALYTGPVHPQASSGLCLDVVGQGTANGTPVEVWACSGAPNQQWSYDGTSLRVYGSKCLDVPSGNLTDGTRLQIWDCFPGNTNQKWTQSGSQIQWAGKGKCLDLTDGVAASGTPIQSWGCYAGDANQSWMFDKTPPGGGGGSSSSGSGGGSGSGSGSGGSAPPTQPAPSFGSNVLVFDPSMPMSSIQSQLDAVYAQQDSAQFGSGRYAYFFKPGQYDLDVKVGFYTEVVGLGASPDDVVINGAVRAKADWLGSNNATCNFWRGAENLAVVPSGSIDGGVNRWGVSQGTHLRRLHVRGDIDLDDGGWSSGGFIADSLIDGQINSGTQQQFLTRNNDQNWTGANWNMVFVGNGWAPGGSWPYPPYTVITKTPVVREKPYLFLDSSGSFQVMVPSLQTGSQGRSWAGGATPGTALPISRFYVAQPSDGASTLNAALAAGENLILTPGIYRLDSPLQVSIPGTIVLGLGLATIIPRNGNAAVTVDDVSGVTLAGLLLEAGTSSSPTLLELGPSTSGLRHSANPTAIFDVHCRVGGADDGTASSCVTVNSDDVLLDNMWLWRADHGADAYWTGNQSRNGLIVNGDYVTAYGLFVEHFQEYQTLWNGNGGSVYFYQSEMPYDPPDQSSWQASPGHNGYPSYKVADGVTSHTAEGLGVYSVFSNYVSAENAFETPTGSGISVHHMVTVSLASGTIAHIINGTGSTVGSGNMTAFSPD